MGGTLKFVECINEALEVTNKIKSMKEKIAVLPR